jgi:hypothetical protein
MQERNCGPRLFVLAGLFSLLGGTAEAAVVHFRYVPADSCANTTLKPSHGIGESSRWFGTVSGNGPLRPTHVVNFRHPYTSQKVSVPLALPEGTPTIMHGLDRITFNYGSYAVRVRFFADGSVDVAYDSGFLRAP